MDYSNYYTARKVIEEFLEKDLIGPLVESETITDTDPIRNYSMGILYPQGYFIGQEESEKDRIDDSDPAEQALNMCNTAHPSSYGMSFTLNSGVNAFKLECAFAWYMASEKENPSHEEHPYNWIRHYDKQEVEFDTNEPREIFNLGRGLELHVYLQKEYKDGSKTYTIALVNANVAGKDFKTNNELSFFQSNISATGIHKEKELFIERQLKVGFKKDPELLNLEMLYLHNKTFAVGHGCSVSWTSAGDYASELKTTFLPQYDLLQMKPAYHIEKNVLSWERLAEGNREDICKSLTQLTASYRKWIKKRLRECETLPSKYQDAGEENLRLCNETLGRLESSIILFEKDDDVFTAFQLANQAMLDQRVRQAEAKNEKYVRGDLGWYPFQLAFILQEIYSVADPTDKYRNLVDLLWFPTGGGKTEAYLGLSAFTIFYRRLKAIKNEKSGAGVTIIMRYTLRLLTLQQFERAASLICASELLRKKNVSKLGKEEISIGLWVGGGLTPNSRKDAVTGLQKIKSEGFESLKEGDHNPCQVLSCPWCATGIKPANYSISTSKMEIKCSNFACEFSSGLPLYLIDEDIYEYKPTLIVSTIDKFARMTWEKRVGELFGLESPLLPPELIIQDELHLISGPLGTIAGLYEIAIEMFCRNNGITPKIIASTATIRNAEHQILNLYGKDYRQFPPQGIDIRDSYFAQESTRDDSPSRKYLGVMAPGKSATTMLVRIYGVLLYASRYLKDLGYSDDVVDSFWTITGYFNNLKQLGGAVVHVLDDVQARLNYLCGKKFKQIAAPPFMSEREYTRHDELTSRKSSSEIGKVLKDLEIKYPNEGAYDFIMASNMISVGVDVGRLGVMFVNGQPKSNAEYIQATSRVGRKTPGLVIALQDSARSRDRSHYEQFVSYHSSVYKYVEATSLTPFSERARERALHAVLISMCRHLIRGLRDNSEAKYITEHKKEALEFANFILDKVKLIDKRETEATKEHLNKILNDWEYKAGNELVYQRRGKDSGIPLLVEFDDPYGGGFSTLNSMRNVDTESKVYLEGKS